jgi:hypothetical protein
MYIASRGHSFDAEEKVIVGKKSIHPITLHPRLPVNGIRRMLKAEGAGWFEVAASGRQGRDGRENDEDCT